MEGIRVVRVKTLITRNEGFFLRILDYLSYMFSALFLSLFEERPDVVISTSPHLFTAMAGVMYGLLRRVPHVFEIRDLWPATILVNTGMKPGLVYRLLEKLELWLYARSRRLISFTNSFVHDLTTRGVPRNKIDVVINGSNLELFSPRERDADVQAEYQLSGRFVIGYLGTMGLSHGLERVLEAAKILENSNAIFLFVGVGAAKQGLMDRTKDLGLTNVVFVPRQNREDMPKFWSVCDISLIHLRDAPLFKTVIPSKIFESMAMGVPILYAGPEGEGTSIVERHQAGLVVPAESPEALVHAITRLMDDAMLRKHLGENSLGAAPQYSRDRMAEATLATLLRAQEEGQTR
jgi:glycosyltransferase involved in cell wall biosynthesis